jgi:MGT family glycosyltransferase
MLHSVVPRLSLASVFWKNPCTGFDFPPRLQKTVMSRILVYNVPLRGHTTPLFPVIKELASRGAQIVYCLTPNYRPAIEAAGAEFRLLPAHLMADDYFDVRKLDTGNPIRTAEALISTNELLLPELLPFVEDFQPDVIIHDAMCPWGLHLSQITGIPSVSSMTMFMLNNRLFAGSSALWQVIRMILSQLPDIHRYRQAESRLRRKYAVRLPWRLEEFLNSPGTMTLTYSSPLLLPAGYPPNDTFVNVGPTIGSVAEKDDFPFERLTKKPLVYASLGTLTNRNSRFYEHCLEAFNDSDFQLVLSTGARAGLAAREREGVIIREFVPQLKILQRAAVFISHAGMNSVHESLYYKVPLLMAPQQVEQQVVAAQVVRAGAGLCLGQTPSAASLRAGVEQILGDSQYEQSAGRVSESLRKAGGPVRAADAIEKLMTKLTSIPSRSRAELAVP